MITHEELVAQALKRKEVKEEYDRLHGEFSNFDHFKMLKNFSVFSVSLWLVRFFNNLIQKINRKKHFQY